MFQVTLCKSNATTTSNNSSMSSASSSPSSYSLSSSSDSGSNCSFNSSSSSSAGLLSPRTDLPTPIETQQAIATSFRKMKYESFYAQVKKKLDSSINGATNEKFALKFLITEGCRYQRISGSTRLQNSILDTMSGVEAAATVPYSERDVPGVAASIMRSLLSDIDTIYEITSDHNSEVAMNHLAGDGGMEFQDAYQLTLKAMKSTPLWTV